MTWFVYGVFLGIIFGASITWLLLNRGAIYGDMQVSETEDRDTYRAVLDEEDLLALPTKRKVVLKVKRINAHSFNGN